MIPDRTQVYYLAKQTPPLPAALLPHSDRCGPLGQHIRAWFTRARQGKLTQGVLSYYVLQGTLPGRNFSGAELHKKRGGSSIYK